MSLGRDRGAFDMAYDEVVSSEIKAINDLFCDYRDDDRVYESLESFRLETDKRIHDEVIVNLLSDNKINAKLDSMQLWNDEDTVLNTTRGEELPQVKKKEKDGVC